MESYLSQNPKLTFAEIKNIFPDNMLGNVSNRGLIVEDNIQFDSYDRYYTLKDYLSSDDIRYKIYKQWTVHNIDNIIKFARNQGWSVEKIDS